jgi:alpha-beta hydrolase superfamily lysophospholipase
VSALLAPDREEELPVDGSTLHVEHFLPRGAARGVVVFVHGFDAHAARYRHLGTTLADAGFATTLFDCRGHGRSQGRRGHVDRFAQYGSDLAVVVAAARALTPAGPLTLLGHSQGGLVVLDAVLRRVVRPDRMILATPWLGLAMPVPWWKRAASPLFARVWPTMTMANGLRASDISRNPAAVASRDADPLVHHVATARWFEEVLATQRRIRAGAEHLPVPTLVLVAGQDKIVSSAATMTFAQAAGPAVAIRRYEALYHDVFVEPEQGDVVADVVAWLCAPVAAASDLDRAPVEVPGII